MKSINWHDRLKLFQSSGALKNKAPVLKKPISSLCLEPPLIIPASFSVRQASKAMLAARVNFAIVCDKDGVLQGILRRDAVHSAMLTRWCDVDFLCVKDVMSRNVCIEPEHATVSEVMARLTFGGCFCTVVINAKGKPCSLVSPEMLVSVLEMKNGNSSEFAADVKMQSH